MQSSQGILRDVATGTITPFGRSGIPSTHSSAVYADRTEVLYRETRDLHFDSASIRRQGLLLDLDERQDRVAARDGRTILSTLADAGFSWTDVARMVNVSIPAIQKWRRGSGMSGVNRLRLARVAALLDMLEARFISQPASWLEMPVKDAVAINRIDMIAHGRFDLVLELASDDGESRSLDAILDEFKSNWRSTHVDHTFEVFEAADGVVSIRPKG